MLSSKHSPIFYTPLTSTVTYVDDLSNNPPWPFAIKTFQPEKHRSHTWTSLSLPIYYHQNLMIVCGYAQPNHISPCMLWSLYLLLHVTCLLVYSIIRCNLNLAASDAIDTMSTFRALAAVPLDRLPNRTHIVLGYSSFVLLCPLVATFFEVFVTLIIHSTNHSLPAQLISATPIL